jgi:rubredoxin
MIPTIQNPIFKCSLCGKEEEQKGAVSTGIPEYWACRECRAKMKQFSLAFTFYEDGYAEVSGNCDFCKQYPCRHGNEEGEFNSPINPVKLPIDLRKRWLEKLMTFPMAKIFPNIWKFPLHSLGQPAHEVTVYWPLGEGGRPAEVYAEIQDILICHGCTLTTYKTDNDDHLGWVHLLAEPAPSEKKVKTMLRRDGDGIERMADNLINWDWKEARATMIEDLNEAMEALKIPLKWKLGES